MVFTEKDIYEMDREELISLYVMNKTHDICRRYRISLKSLYKLMNKHNVIRKRGRYNKDEETKV